MNDEYADRQQAIKLRLAGHPVEDICRILGRTRAWFHIWWRRYRALGPNGLFDLTRANVQPRQISPDLERTIVTIRQRLVSQVHPGTRYSLIGASTILAELQALHLRPLPSPRTIERVLQRNGISVPTHRPTPAQRAGDMGKCGWRPFSPTRPIRCHWPTSPISCIKWTVSVRSI